MLETPQLAQTTEQLAAVIRLTIPREQIKQLMHPAIEEILATLAGQGIAPAGPLFTLHFRIDPAVFDLEVGVPVTQEVKASGRVKPGRLPAAKVIRAVYRGPYEGLAAAWGELMEWIKSNGHTPAAGAWESYVSGPESGPDPTQWRTELNRPVV